MRTAIIISAVLLISPMAWGAVYKCKDESGAIVFSDRPCGASAERIELRTTQPTPPPAPATAPEATQPAPAAPQGNAVPPQETAKADEGYTEREFASLAASGKVVEGMSFANVRRAFGEPEHTYRRIHENGVTEVWEYLKGRHKGTAVYFMNGKVITINSDGQRQ